jgi:hypothetical protein
MFLSKIFCPLKSTDVVRMAKEQIKTYKDVRIDHERKAIRNIFNEPTQQQQNDNPLRPLILMLPIVLIRFTPMTKALKSSQERINRANPKRIIKIS